MNKIVLATENDKNKILSLYDTARGGPAGWNEFYPIEEEIDFDLSRDALYIMKNEADEIIATISIDDDEAVSSLDCWSAKLAPGAELSRLCIRKDMQNQGLSKKMMQHVFEILKNNGYKSVHILVTAGHVIARKSYTTLGFKEVGKSNLFDRDYICMEIEL